MVVETNATLRCARLAWYSRSPCSVSEAKRRKSSATVWGTIPSSFDGQLPWDRGPVGPRVEGLRGWGGELEERERLRRSGGCERGVMHVEARSRLASDAGRG